MPYGPRRTPIAKLRADLAAQRKAMSTLRWDHMVLVRRVDRLDVALDDVRKTLSGLVRRLTHTR